MTDTTTGTAEISVRADAGLAAAPGRGRAGLRAPGERNPAAYWFLAPALVLIFTFFFLPVVAALALSFTDFDIYAVGDLDNTRWVGLRNYTQLLDTPLFWQALRNTFYFALVGGPLSIAVSLAAALLLNQKLVRWKGFFRTVYFAPFVTTLVAVAIVWRYLYHTRYGLLNYVLGAVGVGPVDWLGDPRWAMPAIILMTVWKSFGYN
ncbi:MAG TPA: sugar ABC transporter permease, partial [Longimicrobium sp.]|nr:sugar ABC transporter permease [Longimicrobium sp.]